MSKKTEAKKNSKKRTAPPRLSAQSLKAILWETIIGLKEGRVDVKTANSIASQSREVARVVKIELEMAKLLKIKPKNLLG